MRTQCHRTIRILFILLIGSAGLQPGFAKGGRGPGHVYSNSSAARPSSSAKPALRGANNTQVPVKADTAHTAVPRGTDKPRDIDTRISVQPRQLGKSVNPSVKPLSVNPYHPRALSALPKAPTSSARNAIGIPIPPRGNVTARNRSRPNSPIAAPSVRSLPHSSNNRVAGVGGVLDHMPHSPLNVVSAAASRGVISGRDWPLAIWGRRRSEKRTQSRESTAQQSSRTGDLRQGQHCGD
jgi:hypothetical protein